MVSWEVVLSKGQEWDWFGDPFCRVQTLATLFVVGLGGLDLSRAADRQPADQFPDADGPQFPRLLHHHLLRLSACCTPTPISLPALLQSLFGYDATTSGLVLSPAGIFRGHDAVRRRHAAGPRRRCALSDGRRPGRRWRSGNYWMSRMNLEISPWQVVWPRVVLIIGLSMLFAPLNVAAFMYIPRRTARRGGRACSRCCATKAAASAPPWPRRSRSAANSFTRCG